MLISILALAPILLGKGSATSAAETSATLAQTTSGATTVAAQADADWPEIELSLEAGGLEEPIHLTHAGDGSLRLFVVEHKGRVRIVKDGVLQSRPFLDITDRVVISNWEQGLLSIAFPPGYADKGYFYVTYTDASGTLVMARYHVTTDPNIANPDSEEVLLTVEQPTPTHNGGHLVFGPQDGYLYIGLGDGRGPWDTVSDAQDPSSLLGKLLRIDVESGMTPYAIPDSNPYVGVDGHRGEIWALGLRNPWRFSFDQETKDLYIGDVGAFVHEEIDHQPASSSGGENYGWNITEGFHCYNAPSCDLDEFTMPILEYTHEAGNCAVIGGQVYRGRRYYRLRGIYFYADFCSGRIWGLRRSDAGWENELLYDADFEISSFGSDAAGNLYITNYNNGDIYKLTGDPLHVLYLPLVAHAAPRSSGSSS